MPYDDILCSWLVRSALVSLTILLIGSGAVLIWRQPLRRVRIIELVLAGCLIAPWLGMIPGYPQLSVAWWHAAAIKQQEAPLPPPIGPMIEPAIPEPTMAFPVSDRVTLPVAGTTTVETPVTVEAPVHAFEIRPWIVGVYVAGVAVATAWWLVGIAGLARLLWTSKPAPLRCRKVLTEISGGRSDRVRLLVSRRLNQPFASAWGRAVIVLPENLCGDEQALRWCLAHEWAHVDGHDFRSWLLAGLARVLFFYQPLLWWLRRQLRLCQDFVADSQAARQAPEVEDYAECLTARAAGRLHPALGLSMGCRKSELYRRVIMLLNNESLESRTPRLWTVSVTVAALMLVAVVAAVSLVPWAVAEEKPAAGQSEEASKKTISPPKELAVSPAKELTVDLGKGIKLEMVLIPAGEFIMGSSDSDKWGRPDEKPQHRVRITKPFYLSKYLVTQEQFGAVAGFNPSRFTGASKPVDCVSWDECQVFLSKLQAKVGSQGGKFVLPTEAQWEYACRAGSTGKFCFGDDEKQLGEYAWFAENWQMQPHPVGKKKPNAFGLYDMHGNVWERCQDRYGTYGSEAVTDPTGPTTGSDRVIRGGDYTHADFMCRSTVRISAPLGRCINVGLRVSLIPTDKAVPKANDQSGKTSAAKPAAEVSSASGQSATKECAKTESKPAPVPGSTAEPTTEQARVIALIEKVGGKVFRDETSPGKPVILVSLVASNVTDAELASLKGLTELQNLILNRTQITDAGLVNLKGLTHLHSLQLYNTRITDAGLAYLRGLNLLRVLLISNPKITDTGLAQLAGMTQLERLSLDGTAITNAGLAHLAGLTQLQLLCLTNTNITDAAQAHLAGMTRLKSLNLSNSKITDAGLRHLAGLTQLQVLYLDNTKTTNAGLVHLAGLTQLQWLFLGNTQITDTGLEDLKALTQLKVLVLRGTQATESGVKKLQQALPKCTIDRSSRPDEKPVSLNLPRLPTAQAERVKTVKIRIDSLMTGVKTYRLDVGDFPTTEQGLQALRVRPAGLAKPERWSGPYLPEDVPLDPWHHPYHYRYPSKHNTFEPDIWSLGPDGIDGTADDIGSWMNK